jgi:type IV pili sensor histidine kinase/response regulator
MRARCWPVSFLTLVLAAGCAQAPEKQHTNKTPRANVPSEIPPAPPEPIAAVRHNRYTLVEVRPDVAQRDPLQQIIETRIPPALDATVGGALRHVLARSGYRLCVTPDIGRLATLPLPAPHLRLGPMTLADALQTLGGAAWRLTVDAEARVVCFTRKSAQRPVTPQITQQGRP